MSLLQQPQWMIQRITWIIQEVRKKIDIHSALSVFTPHKVVLLIGVGNRAESESRSHN